MDRIEIKGYKSFKDLALDLLPINIKATSCLSLNSSTACTNRS